jgi:uroporphyrinogen-III synthase
MESALAGATVALAEGRQLEELAHMLEKEGAQTLRCPMVSILDAPDPAPVTAWIRRLIAGRFAYVVLLTGEGLRRLLGFAEREDLRQAFLSALGQTRMIVRGPKPVRALKEVGLQPTKIADQPTTAGVIAALQSEPLQGRTVGVQLYSPDNPPLIEYLAKSGAQADPIQPYVYAPKADQDRVADLIRGMAIGEVNVMVFTSSPQVDRLYEVAAEQKLEKLLRDGLARACVAAVGPVLADRLREHGVRVDICPEQGYVMKNLVQQLKRLGPIRSYEPEA